MRAQRLVRTLGNRWSTFTISISSERVNTLPVGLCGVLMRSSLNGEETRCATLMLALCERVNP